MKMINKLPAVIYHTFIDRRQDIPYFRTIVTIIAIVFMHAMHIILLFDISTTYIVPWRSHQSKTIQWIYGIMYFLAIYILLSLLFKEKSLAKIIVTPQQMRRCRILLPIYLIACAILFLGLLIKLGIERGTIKV